MICIIAGEERGGEADLPTMWSYHNSLEQVPKNLMLALQELNWGITGR
jgi:hypothetical protein